MPSVSPFRCSEITGVTSANTEGMLKHFFLHSQWWWLRTKPAIVVSTATLKHFKPHYQPDSLASPSESLWKSNNPARRSLRLSAMSEHRLYNSCQTLTHTHREKLFCCCLFLLNFAVRHGFQCTFSQHSILKEFKSQIQSMPMNCIENNLQSLSAESYSAPQGGNKQYASIR